MTDLQWKWGGSCMSSGKDFTPTWHTTEHLDLTPIAIPAVIRHAEQMAEKGFQLSDHSSLNVTRHTSKTGREPDVKTSVGYSVGYELFYAKDDAHIVYRLSGGGDTVEEVIANASLKLDRCPVRYSGDPLNMGDGQTRRAKEIATKLFSKYAEFLNKDACVEVRVMTRGGRYGASVKVAHREFDKASLLPRKNAPSIFTIFEEQRLSGTTSKPDWQKMERIKASINKDGHLVFRRFHHKLTRTDAEYAYFNLTGTFYGDSEEKYRIPLKDWERLLEKHQ